MVAARHGERVGNHLLLHLQSKGVFLHPGSWSIQGLIGRSVEVARETPFRAPGSAADEF